MNYRFPFFRFRLMVCHVSSCRAEKVEHHSCVCSLSVMKFFQSIGSPQRIVAPMVDHSGLAYRMLCRKYGAELVYTQMFSARQFVESEVYRRENFQTVPGDRPLIVQFCGIVLFLLFFVHCVQGNDPQMLLRAAKLVENDCDGVDINLGTNAVQMFSLIFFINRVPPR